MRDVIRGRNLVAIDIGTTKICVLVAEVDSNGLMDIVGFGKYPSCGLKKGVVASIPQTANSIKKAVDSAREMSGVKIESAVVGISGSHIKSFNSRGIVAIKNKDVSQHDIDRVVDVAKSTSIIEDREILHIFPQYFRVDGQELVQDSLGMHGVRLESQIHIVTGSVSSAQNIVKACELAGIEVLDIVLEQIASSEAVLTESEKSLGIGILDIGGGTSDFAIYKDGKVRHSKVLPVAGNLFTSDLAIGLGISLQQAEEVKRLYGFVDEDFYLDADQDRFKVDIEHEGEKKLLDKYLLFEILEPRAQEIISMIISEINEFKLNVFMPAGVVLTGGGALLKGFFKIAAKRFRKNVRIGIPINDVIKPSSNEICEKLKSPIYSTSYGLLVYALQGKDCSMISARSDRLVDKIFKSMKSWIYDFF